MRLLTARSYPRIVAVDSLTQMPLAFFSYLLITLSYPFFNKNGITFFIQFPNLIFRLTNHGFLRQHKWIHFALFRRCTCFLLPMGLSFIF